MSRQNTSKRGRRFVALYRQQREFLEADTSLVAFCAGLGSGKSRTGATRILLRAGDGESHLCISPSYVMLRKSTLPLMVKVAKELGVHRKTVLTPYPVVTFETQDGGTAEAMFQSGDDPEGLRASNNDSCWLDEASLMSPDVRDIAIGRLRGVGGKMGAMTFTFTPRGRDWCFKTFWDEHNEMVAGPAEAEHLGLMSVSGKYYRPKPNTTFVRARSSDNPFISEDFYTNIRGIYSAQFAEQELHAEIVELAGLLFHRKDLLYHHTVDMAPRVARRVRYWDLAATEFDGCYSCGALLAMTQHGEIYIEDIIRGQWSTFTRNTMIKEQATLDARRYNNEVTILVEQEPGSGGKEQAQQLIRMLSGHPVYRDLPSHGQATRSSDGQRLPGAAKVYRAQPLAAQVEAHNVRIVSGAWTDEFLAEMTAFPESTVCDQVDACSAAYNYLAKSQVPNPQDIGLVSAHSNVPGKYGMPTGNRRYELPSFIGRN